RRDRERPPRRDPLRAPVPRAAAPARGIMPGMSNIPTGDELDRGEAAIRQGGGAKAVDRQHAKGRLTARERVARLLDPGTDLFELGLWAAWGMYEEWGGAPSAGVVTGVGPVAGRRVMV